MHIKLLGLGIGAIGLRGMKNIYIYIYTHTHICIYVCVCVCVCVCIYIYIYIYLFIYLCLYMHPLANLKPSTARSLLRRLEIDRAPGQYLNTIRPTGASFGGSRFQVSASLIRLLAEGLGFRV